MPAPTLDDAEDLLPAEEQQAPPPVPAQEAPPTRTVVSPPRGATVYPPANYVPSVQWTNAAQPPAAPAGGDLLRQQVANMPIDQAAEAVATATRFQALRGYQRDLQNGTPSHEALAKWAPLLFTSPKPQPLTGAASMIRATQPVVRNASGQLFRVGPSGPAVPLTPAPVKPPRADPFATMDYRQRLAHVSALQKGIDEGTSTDPDTDRQMIQEELREASKIRASQGAARPSGKRIKVKHPGGKTGTIPEEQRDEAIKAGYTLVP